MKNSSGSLHKEYKLTLLFAADSASATISGVVEFDGKDLDSANDLLRLWPGIGIGFVDVSVAGDVIEVLISSFFFFNGDPRTTFLGLGD